MKLRGSIHRSANAINNVSKDISISKEHFRRVENKCKNCNEVFSTELKLSPDLKKGQNEIFRISCPNCDHKKNIILKH